jgi:hypothetical protein
MKEGLASRSIVFIGDNKSFEDIESMVSKGIVPAEKFSVLKRKYTERHDICLRTAAWGSCTAIRGMR